MMLWCRDNVSASSCQCKTIMSFKNDKENRETVMEVAKSWPLSWYRDETKVISTIFIITY